MEPSLPQGVTALGDGLFAGCASLTRVHLPPDLRTVGARAFFRCRALTELHLPDSVEAVGAGAFYGCDALERLSLADGIQEMERSPFSLPGYDLFWKVPMRRITIRFAAAADGLPLVDVPIPPCDDMHQMFALGYYELLAASPHGPFDFPAYDELFRHRESDLTRCVIALSRLACPKHLQEEPRARYLAFLRRHGATALSIIGQLQKPGWMTLLEQAGAIRPDNIDMLLELAARIGSAEITAYLLEYQSRDIGFSPSSRWSL